MDVKGCRVQRHIRLALRVLKTMDTVMGILLVCMLLIVGSALLDLLRFSSQAASITYTDFRQLSRINPDICGWLQIAGTGIDLPVVQGRDNYEYLNKGFSGDVYAGGCLFLDTRYPRDLSSACSLIHGHNITGGIMFGDLPKYSERSYFLKHRTGLLMTPDYDYRLRILVCSEIDAYDSTIYGNMHDAAAAYRELKDHALQQAGTAAPRKLLLLSTCAGSMDDRRIVLCCSMTDRKEHQ